MIRTWLWSISVCRIWTATKWPYDAAAGPLADSVHLVAVTGRGDETDRLDSLSAGFDEHLVKPVNLGVLFGLLNGPRPTA